MRFTSGTAIKYCVGRNQLQTATDTASVTSGASVLSKNKPLTEVPHGWFMNQGIFSNV